MQRDLKRLAEETFDLLIVGGGINGLAAAWDAALRGLQTALIERGDFGGETSSGSLRIIHGGLRYLQHLDLVRMRQSIVQRSTLMRIAPHLIRPLPFLVPAYGHGIQGRWAMTAASRLNDLISGDRNRWLTPLGRALPNGEVLSRAECLARAPGLDPRGLTGGVVFHDGQMESSERMSLSFALGAASRGAAIANRVEAVGLIREGGRIVGVEAVDRVGGGRLEIRARVVVNTAGPWAELLVRPQRGDDSRRVRLSKGFQLVTRLLTGEVGLAVVSRHRDPDAVLHRGGRHYFITPWRGVSVVGNTDELYEGDPDAWRITEAEIAAFIAEVNQAFPAGALGREDVRHAYGGLQAIDPRRLGRGAQVAKHHRIIDHEKDLKLKGMLTVIGVKYTGCRWLAERVVDRVCGKLGYKVLPCLTGRAPLVGGDIGSIHELRARVDADAPAGTPAAVRRHLARQYGTRYARLYKLMRDEPALAACLPGSDEVTGAEVVYAARNEAAGALADVVLRRTDLGTLGHPGRPALEAAAALVARELGWDGQRVAREVDEVEAGYRFPEA